MTTPSIKSAIPFGAQFSPKQVDLIRVLAIIHENAGDRGRITEAIRDEFFKDHAATQRRKLAGNTVLALRAYGLLQDDGATPTILAAKLLSYTDSPVQLYEQFAKHILISLRGVDLLDTIQAMLISGETITLHTLRKWLEQRGLHVPRGAVHLSSIRLWLAQAGVFDEDAQGGRKLYEFDQERVEELLGMELDAIDQLSQLNKAQRAYLRALTTFPESAPLVANKVADLATTLYGVEYNHKELPKSVLFPLRDLGYISLEKTTAGRGAKPYEVIKTVKFLKEINEPVLEGAAAKAELVPKQLFERSLDEILADLKNPSTHVKGQALELLAIYLTRLIDLEFKGWRLRSAATGGAEVDAIVEGARLIFNRWQIQAKNTRLVRLDDVAKEVGLALTFIYSNVVMMVTTGKFTKDAYDYARHVMVTSNLNIILLDRSELRMISQDPTNIASILNRKAANAMRIKARTDYFHS